MIVHDQRVLKYVANALPHDPGAGLQSGQGFAVIRKGRIVAGVVFHDFDPHSKTVELTAAATSKLWALRRDMEELGGYAFGFAQLVTARTSEKNRSARRFWKAIGGREHVIPRLFGRTEAGVVLTLTKEQFHEGIKSPTAA